MTGPREPSALREDPPVEISVVCPVTVHVADLPLVHREIETVLAGTGRSFEFIYVVDGPWTGAEAALGELPRDRRPVRVYRTARGFGESTALQFGLNNARGQLILTIADRPQIDARVVLEVLALLDRGREAVVTRREPRIDAGFNRLQSRVFHAIVRRLVGHDFQDLSCGLRGFTRAVALQLDLYGDQHRFIPIIAARAGSEVLEIPGAQHPRNTALRLRVPGTYARRLLDILNVYFLTRFTRKPLRFFGLIGLVLGALGFGVSAWLAVERLLGRSALADRPLLLLGVLLIVLGVQVLSIGLIGEIIIFLAARRDAPVAQEIEPTTSAPALAAPDPAQRRPA